MTFFTIVFFEQRPWCIIGYGVPKEILFLSLLYTHLLLSTRFKLLYRAVLHPDGVLDKQQDYKMRRYEGLAPDQLGETNFKWQMTLHDSSWHRDNPQINLFKTYLKATIFNFIFLYSLLIIPSNIARNLSNPRRPWKLKRNVAWRRKKIPTLSPFRISILHNIIIKKCLALATSSQKKIRALFKPHNMCLESRLSRIVEKEHWWKH